LYQLCDGFKPLTNLNDYYSENVITGIAESNADVLKYFSESFTITDTRGDEHWLIYPYLGNVIEALVNKKSPFAEAVLKRAIEHNKKVFKVLREMLVDAEKISTERYANWYEDPADIIREEVLGFYSFNDRDHFISYFYSRGKHDCPRLCANMVYVDMEISVNKDLSLMEAHDIAERLHENIEKTFSNVKHVMIHVNPALDEEKI